MKLTSLPASKCLFLILTSVLSLPSNGFGQVCSGCEVSTQTVTKANNLLILNDDQKDEAEEVHLLGGRPIAPSDATNEHLIHQKEWIACKRPASERNPYIAMHSARTPHVSIPNRNTLL